MADIPEWHVAGGWFDVCKCSIPCPCSFAQSPTTGDCDGILVWHIREGRYGNTALDDLNVVLLASFVGNIWGEHSDEYAAVFLDERADESQREALQMIFGGQAGGWPGTLMSTFGAEVRGSEFSPIEVSIADDLASWSAEIPGRLTARAEALTGPTTPEGARVQTVNLPGSETGPGQVATWGRATADRADAFEFSWDREGRSSKHITFDWSGPE
ncbi:DUF1326 domain-containing protein [Pseudonocardia sp. H11422]|uniref:DUF1326 domain-containing protein n=1 Tax=Pseudonocardia sp. H11422 TaxID=2835866 RepID=UPI001BDDA5B1|nr:DUF1326 domain-containing protein [Pseudonocardia sp. H11422]